MGLQRSEELTQRPSAQGTMLPFGSLAQVIVSSFEKEAIQNKLLLAQKPLRHLTGASEGHLVIVQFTVLGSTQSPVAHRSGVLAGQPLESGH